MNVAFIYAYFENKGMLAEQYRTWANYPDELKSELEIIVVDAGGEKADALDVPRPEGLPWLKIYRLLHHERWNQDVARNLGAKAARAQWLLLTDMDHLVTTETLSYVFEKKNKSLIYTFSRVDAPDMKVRLRRGQIHTHPNSFLMTRDMYWEIGGYDERLVGIYGTDSLFVSRAKRHAEFKALHVPLVRYPREVIPDASTTSLTRRGPENDKEKWKLERIRIEGTQDKIEVLTRPWERLL